MMKGIKPSKFASDLRKLGEKLELLPEVVTAKVALDVVNEIAFISPVDTGRYLASTGIAENSVPADPGEPEQKKKLGTTQIASKGKSRQQHAPSPVLVIYNNLPYAEALENGHSGQAPYGVFRIAQATVEAEVETTLGAIIDDIK